MSKLLQDFENYTDFNNSDVNELSMSMLMKLTKLEDGRFNICFHTPVGRYSEIILDYGDLYEALGHLFAEENGIVNHLFKR